MTNNGIQATLIYWYSDFSAISFSKFLRQNAYLLYATVCKCLVYNNASRYVPYLHSFWDVCFADAFKCTWIFK